MRLRSNSIILSIFNAIFGPFHDVERAPLTPPKLPDTFHIEPCEASDDWIPDVRSQSSQSSREWRREWRKEGDIHRGNSIKSKIYTRPKKRPSRRELKTKPMR